MRKQGREDQHRSVNYNSPEGHGDTLQPDFSASGRIRSVI
jgi:hypothetical protein